MGILSFMTSGVMLLIVFKNCTMNKGEEKMREKITLINIHEMTFLLMTVITQSYTKQTKPYGNFASFSILNETNMKRKRFKTVLLLCSMMNLPLKEVIEKYESKSFSNIDSARNVSQLDHRPRESFIKRFYKIWTLFEK